MSNRAIGRIAAVFLALAAAGALFRPLAEPDEGRYAEAAREMVAEGDWLLPRQSGEVYPDKPPGVYWAMAVAMAFLGQTALAARLPALLALAGVLLLLSRRAARDQPALGAAAAWIAAGCPLLLVLGQLSTLDMVLTFFTTAGILTGWSWLMEGVRGQAWLAGACMGAGFR